MVSDLSRGGQSDSVTEMIQRITSPEERSRIAEEILVKLPEWFGIPESTAQYVSGCASLPLWADVEEGGCRGFIAMRQTSDCAAEIFVMGVDPHCHRRGIGRALFGALRDEAKRMNLEYLHVKTVRTGKYEIYDRTNLFYRSLGFRELECLPELWDAENPCQLYIMTI